MIRFIIFSITLLIISCSTGKTKSSIKEVWGERLHLVGDFNGDGIKDTLKEVFVSSITKKETNKYYENITYDSMVSLTASKMPFVSLISNRSLPELKFTSSTGQIFGIRSAKNIGDINGDDSDEIAIVIDWADYSNINQCYVYTYASGNWKGLFSFETIDDDTTNYLTFLKDSLINISIIDKKLSTNDTTIVKVPPQKIDIYFTNKYLKEPFYLPTHNLYKDSIKIKECDWSKYPGNVKCYEFDSLNRVISMNIQGSGVAYSTNYFYTNDFLSEIKSGRENYLLEYNNNKNLQKIEMVNSKRIISIIYN